VRSRACAVSQLPGLAAAVDALWSTGRTSDLAALIAGSFPFSTSAYDEAAPTADEVRGGALALLSAKVASLAGVWRAVQGLYADHAIVSAKTAKPKAAATSSGASKAAANGSVKGGANGASVSVQPTQPQALDLGPLRSYDGFSGPVRRLAAHQALALNRGKASGLLNVTIGLPEGDAGCGGGGFYGGCSPELFCRRLVDRELRKALPWLSRSGGRADPHGWIVSTLLLDEACTDALSR